MIRRKIRNRFDAMWTKPKALLAALLARRIRLWQRQGETYLQHWRHKRGA
ncbi:MAG: hypothetical protein Kow0092_03110 [Deferrisomatales bacterium]